MSIQLIANTVFRDCAQLLVTDSADVATSDATNLENVSRGPRHLEASIAAGGARRVVFLSKGGGLAANVMVGTRADRWSSGYTVRKYSSYTGSPTTIATAGAAPTCVGLNAQDYVLPFSSASNQQAFSLEIAGSAAKTVGKVYFGTTIDFDYPMPVGPTIEPLWAAVQLGRHSYMVRERIRFTFSNVTRTLMQSLEQSYRLHEEPCFLYDSAGTLLADKVWHVVIGELSAQPFFDDKANLILEAYRLREYPDVA